MIDRCSIDPATPELATSYTYDPMTESFDALEFSPEDDAKLDRAANRGPLAIQDALAGNPDGLVEMARLGVTLWQHERREA